MKKLLSFILATVMLTGAIAVAIPAGAAKSGFSDVEDDRWSSASIAFAVQNGYVKGVGGDLFDPEGSLTRAMVATVLWRREGEPAPASPSGFTDVPAGEWYADAVAWAKASGVVKGITDTTFEPDGLITREQLATMLFRFSSTAPVSVPERADLEPFADDEKVSDWADEPLEWAVQAGLIKGTDGNRLAPGGNATREQFAAIIERYDESFKLEYNVPVIRSQYTEKEYPLVEDADIYVSTEGDDSASGTKDAPLATFAGAVAKVREVKATKTEGDIVVAFKAGNYGAIEAELTAEDGGSPDQRIIYCKYGDGEVLFDNGVTVKEDEFERITEDERAMFQAKRADKIMKIDLNSKLGEIPDASTFTLFSEDGICSVARYPDKWQDDSDHFLEAARTYDEDASMSTLLILNQILARRIANYSDRMISEMLLYGYIVRGYRKDTFTVESFDAENSLLKIGRGSSDEFGGKLRRGWDDTGNGIRMVVMNTSYELDAKGEYWIDRETGALYVFDPSGDYRIPMAHGEKKLRGIVNYDTGDAYNASEGYCAIFAEDTGYITFRGFHFTNNIDEFIIGYKTSGFEIDRCTFDCCTGKNQLLFEKSLPDEPLGLRVTDSEFDLCVGRHVFVFDEARGPNRFTDRSDVLVDNCLFRRSNLVYDAEGAVNLFSCSGGLVSHNRFENCYRYAVMFTWSCDVIVEYNDFDSAMTNSDDGGVTRGCDDVLGNNVVRYNFYNTCAKIGHYCDNGDCGTVMYSNLFYNGGSVVYHGPCRDNVLENNVMIGDSVGGIVGSATHTDEFGNVTADKNEWLRNQWVNAFLYCDTVPGYREALEERKPGATNIILDYDQAADPNFFVAPVNTFVGNMFFNEKAETKLTLLGNAPDYCTVEGNVAYSLNENPIFVNPTRGDYRIREGVDFPDIRFEDIGRY